MKREERSLAAFLLAFYSPYVVKHAGTSAKFLRELQDRLAGLLRRSLKTVLLLSTKI